MSIYELAMQRETEQEQQVPPEVVLEPAPLPIPQPVNQQAANLMQMSSPTPVQPEEQVQYQPTQTQPELSVYELAMQKSEQQEEPVQQEVTQPQVEETPLPPQSAGEMVAPTQYVPQSERAPSQPYEESSIDKAIQNIPASAKGVAMDTYEAARHPVETVKTIGKLGSGLVELMIPGEQGNEQMVHAVKDHFINRYGSPENALKTFETDPVGMAFDIVSALTTTGTAVRYGGKAAGISKMVDAGTAMQKTGQVADAYTIAKRGAQAVSQVVPDKLTSAMYNRAMTFNKKLSLGDRKALVDTALDSEVMPTLKGLEKLEGQISSLNKEIGSRIDRAVYSGKEIRVIELLKGTGKYLHPDSHGTLGADQRKLVTRIRKQLRDEAKRVDRTVLNARQAQNLKTNIYKKLQSEYENGLSDPAGVAAQKQIARNAREFIESAVPGIKQLNKMDGDKIELMSSLRDSANSLTKNDLLKAKHYLATLAGSELAGPKGAAVALSAIALTDPHVHARLAIVINKLKKKGITVGPNAIAVRNALIEASIYTDQEEDEQ